MIDEHGLWRSLLAEFLGSAMLAAVVVGSGIAAQQLSPGDVGLQLFENAAATAAGLFATILIFGPISGAHFNPVVTFVDAAFGGMRWRKAAAYLPAQVAGCIAGAALANVMFSVAAVSWSTKHRASGSHFVSEIVATLGLLLVIFALARSRRVHLAPAAVGAYIGAAYFFTSSASFANPAITVGRMFSNTFAGIAPSSAPVYIGAQVVGGLVAVGLIRALYPRIADAAADVVVPHDPSMTTNGTTEPKGGTSMTDYHDPVTQRHIERCLKSLQEEFAGIFSAETIERYVADSSKDLAGAKVKTFIPVFVDRFARARLRALAQVEGAVAKEVPEVLFVCVHNAGRSQMAACLLDHHAHGAVHVSSAGSTPVDEINPAVVAAMAEIGLDLSQEFPKPVTDEITGAADVIITMGCGDACPIYPGKRYKDWEDLGDPAGKTVEEVRPLRDEIGRRVRALLEELVPTART